MASTSTVVPPAPQPFSTESYFQTQKPPAGLAERVGRVEPFVKRWSQDAGKRVVLVTSGGTTVPLESNTVRFLDNFSAGTRGATSAEYFLKAGYAVVFLHRLHSLRPFSRHYSHSLNPFLDLLSISSAESKTGESSSTGSSTSTIRVSEQHVARLLPVLQAYKRAQEEGTLLQVDFQTINEYLWLLRDSTRAMACLGRRGMFYLAAAVSDFFLPEERTAEHKIQSGHGTLALEMDQVPKVLKPLVQEWMPEGYIVSFKLETDDKLLIPKSRIALSRYGHQLVIGNDLHRRKYEVVFVERRKPQQARAASGAESASGPTSISGPAGDGADEFTETWLRLDNTPKAASGQPDADELEIEELIIRELVTRHNHWIEAKAA